MMSATRDMFPDGAKVERRVLKFIDERKSQDGKFYKKGVNMCPPVGRNAKSF